MQSSSLSGPECPRNQFQTLSATAFGEVSLPMHDDTVFLRPLSRVYDPFQRSGTGPPNYLKGPETRCVRGWQHSEHPRPDKSVREQPDSTNTLMFRATLESLP